MTFGILALGFPVSEVLQLLQPFGFAAFAAFGGLTEVLQVSQVLHPYLHAFLRCRLASWLWGSLFGSFCGGSQSHFLPYIFPIFMHSLGGVWHPGSGVPWPLGAHSLTFFPISSLSYCIPYLYLPYLHAFLR